MKQKNSRGYSYDDYYYIIKKFCEEKDIYLIESVLEIKGVTYVFRPLYQSLFFPLLIYLFYFLLS